MTQRESNDPVERLLDSALRDLPLRRAPARLESRVLLELQRRAALPWWRRSFAHWPMTARAGFIAITAMLVGLAFLGSEAAATGLNSLAWARRMGTLMESAGNLATALGRFAPPSWLYGGIAVCTLLYAILFGLGAVAYRTLYLQPVNGR